MIIYATKLAYDRLHIKPSETLHYALDHIYPQLDYINSVKQMETWSEIYEWYAELFYFKKEKYLRVVHLYSKFTLFFGGVDEAFMHGLGFRIKNALYKYFQDDPLTTHYLDLLYNNSRLNFYSRISDKKRLGMYKTGNLAFTAKHPLFQSCVKDGCPCLDELIKNVNNKPMYTFDGAVLSAVQLLKTRLKRLYGTK